jgi:protein-tyrosine phosphatase
MRQFEGKTALMMGASAALICALALSVHAGRKRRVATKRGVFTVTISNFGKVKDHYFRGAQPDEDQYEELAAIGVKTLIDLRDDAKLFAKLDAEQAGLRYINFPLSDKDYPAANAAERYLQIVNDSRNWPVYVHCAGGRHRTGAMTAVYRMTRDGWDVERAYSEMKDYGFYTRRGHKAMKDYVYDYYRNMQAGREEALKKSRIITRYHDGGINARNYRGVEKTLNLVMCANQETKIILLTAGWNEM